MKRLRSWYFTITKTATKLGTRFLEYDRPTEATFRDLLSSVLFKAESDDRAKEDDAGIAVSDLVGHTVASTDAQAKAKQAKKTDRTLVTQPSQLPEVVEDSDVTLTSGADTYAGPVLTVEDDAAVLTKSSYKLGIVAGLVTFLNLVFTKLSTVIVDTASNASSISTLETTVGGHADVIDALSGGTFASFVPLGMVAPIMTGVAPSGWALIGGDQDITLPRVGYPALATMMDTVHGPPADPDVFYIWRGAHDHSILGVASPSIYTHLDLRVRFAANGFDTEVADDSLNLAVNRLPYHTHKPGTSQKITWKGGTNVDVAEGEFGLVKRGTFAGSDNTTAGSLTDSNSSTRPDLVSTPTGFEIAVEGNSGSAFEHQDVQVELSTLQKTLDMTHIMYVGTEIVP